jgi:hypothetical protein
VSIGQRLLFSDITAGIAAAGSFAVADLAAPIYVSDCFDPKYAELYAQKWPAIWLGAQRLLPRDDGRGFSSMQRQNSEVQIVFRIMVQRFPKGASPDTVEARLDYLYNFLDGALFGKKYGSRMREPLVWKSSVDGQPTQSTCYMDVIYSTTVTNSKAIP